MARFTPIAAIRQSGWAVVYGAEFVGDTDEAIELELEEIRKEAPGKMRLALKHIVAALKKTLSKQYPLLGRESGSRFATAWGTVRRFMGRIRRRPAPPGAPPGLVSGDLRDSWEPKSVRWSRNRTVLTGTYQSDDAAAGALEWGDTGKKSGRPMPSRPYVRPTVAREAPALDRILDGA